MSSLDILELKKHNGAMITRMREIQDKMDDRGSATPQELAEYEKLEKESLALEARIQREQNLQDKEAAIAARNHNVRAVYQGKGNGHSSIPTGIEYVDVLGPGDSYRSYLEQQGHIKQSDLSLYEGLDMGDYLAGIFVGPRGPKKQKIKRALDETEISTGIYLVPTPLSSAWIDLLRPGMPTFQAGAKIIPMDSETLSIPVLVSDVQYNIIPENALITDADPIFDRRLLKAYKLAGLVKFSFEIDEDSPTLGAMLNRSFTAAVRVELEKYALAGLGTGATPDEPLGILNQLGVSEVPTMGLPSSYDGILDGLLELWKQNTEANMVLMSPTNYRTYAGLKESTTNSPLAKPAAITDLPIRMTTSMPNDSILVGDFRDLLYGIRSEIRIQRLSERFAEYGQRAALAWMRFDVALARAMSFCKLTGVNIS